MVGSDLEHRVRAEPHQLTAARQVFVDWLSSRGAPDADVDDWALVFAELAANAVESAPAGTEMSIRATFVDTRVTLRIANVSDGMQLPRVPAGVVDPLAPNGRGLVIVSRLVDGLVFETDDQGICATCWKTSTACAAASG